MASLDDTADDLAKLAIADEARSGDETIIAQIAEVLGASSQTLQEAFLTQVRVRKAEMRARQMLADRASAAKAAAPPET